MDFLFIQYQVFAGYLFKFKLSHLPSTFWSRNIEPHKLVLTIFDHLLILSIIMNSTGNLCLQFRLHLCKNSRNVYIFRVEAAYICVWKEWSDQLRHKLLDDLDSQHPQQQICAAVHHESWSQFDHKLKCYADLNVDADASLGVRIDEYDAGIVRIKFSEACQRCSDRTTFASEKWERVEINDVWLCRRPRSSRSGSNRRAFKCVRIIRETCSWSKRHAGLRFKARRSCQVHGVAVGRCWCSWEASSVVWWAALYQAKIGQDLYSCLVDILSCGAKDNFQKWVETCTWSWCG